MRVRASVMQIYSSSGSRWTRAVSFMQNPIPLLFIGSEMGMGGLRVYDMQSHT